MLLDAAGHFLGIFNTAGAVRFIIGLTWGMILPFYSITGITELFIHMKKRRLFSLAKNKQPH